MSEYIPKTAADFETILSMDTQVGATSFTLSTAADVDGNNLAAGLYGFTLDGDTEYKEFCIGVLSGTTVTGVMHISAQGVPTSGLNTYHRRGAQVAITDWLVLGRLGFVTRGEAGFDSAAPLYYDGNPTFAADAQIVTKKYVDDLVNGGTVSYNQVVLTTQVAGENLTANDHVYFKESDARWYKVDADDSATFAGLKRGIALSTVTTGNVLSVAISGLVAGFSGLTPGAEYYASNTGGAISSTPGTNTVSVGFAFSATVLIFDPYARDIPSGNEKDALAGSQGVPSGTNTYITEDNTTTAGNNQSQLTQNATQTAGAADSTGQANKLAQSFIPTKTKIRGVNLYKSADTGTFTGTVTVALQADTAGAPSGSDLATVTISNATWLATSTGAFEAIFSSEYASLIAGSLYWIVISTSTSDTSNHPNLGTNSAGGYADGSVKYNNTTDGWVAIATVDLYFSTLEGTASQVTVTGSDGKLSTELLPDEVFSVSSLVHRDVANTSLTASEVTMTTVSLTAGQVTDSSVLKVKFFVNVTSANNATRSTTVRVRDGSLAGTVIDTFTFNNTASSAEQGLYVIEMNIVQTTISAQTSFNTLIQVTDAVANTTATIATSAVNFTFDKTLYLTAQINNVTNYSVSYRGSTVELLK